MKRPDPLPAFCFRVQLTTTKGARGDIFFQSVGGLTYETEVVDYREGGVNWTTKRLVGGTKWSNIVLKNGFIAAGEAASDLLMWREAWLNDAPNTKLERVNGSIIQLDHKMKEVCQWDFVGAWPCKWQGPDYDASKTELAIETLELAHEGLAYKVLVPAKNRLVERKEPGSLDDPASMLE